MRTRLSVRRLRDLPIWSKLGLIMIVPTIATIAVGITGLVDNIGQANNADEARTLSGLSREAAALVHELENERAGAALLMGLPDANARATYDKNGQSSDDAAKGFRQQRSALPSVPADIERRLTRIDSQLAGLPDLRKAVIGGTVTLTDAMTNYRVFIDDLIGIRESTAEAAGNEHLATDMRAAAALSAMKEYTSVERVVVLNILAQKSVTPALYKQFVAATNGREDALRRFQSFSEDWQNDLYSDTVTGPDLREASKFEGDISAIGIAALPDNIFTSSQWDSSIAGVAKLLREVEIELDEHVIQDASAERDVLQRRVLLQTGALLGMLLLAILFAWIVARSMARSLRELRHGALTVAQYGLPQAVARLRDPTLATQTSPHQLALQIAEPLPVRSRDEFGQVAEAFNAVHLEAVRTAAEQAALRASVASMFVNLARRSQILVDRLIGHLDRLERGEEDPDRLAELFQLDHLATRMRRNDENLLVLAGADSTRIQREPAPFMDVLRAAQSEVEHYTRIEFGMIDRDIEIAAHAVNDMVHLVAELLDNATAFSPPDSAVVVEARRVGDRAVMLVEDRGIGISPDQLAELNERLANPPMVDAAVSRMMGLVVVARLAARHGVKVELRPARERGTVADLTLPAGVLVPRASVGRNLTGMPSAGSREAVAARPAAPAQRPPLAGPPLALESGPSTPQTIDARRDDPERRGPGGRDGAKPVAPRRVEIEPPSVGIGFGAAAAAFGNGSLGAGPVSSGPQNAGPAGPGGSGPSRPGSKPGSHAPGTNGTGAPGSRGLPAWSDLTGANGTGGHGAGANGTGVGGTGTNGTDQRRAGPGGPPFIEPLPQRRSGDRWTLDGEAIEESEPNGAIPRQRPVTPEAAAPTGPPVRPERVEPTSAPPLPNRPTSGSPMTGSPMAGQPTAGPAPAGPTAAAPQLPTRPTSAPPASRPSEVTPERPVAGAPSQPRPPVWPPVSAPPSSRIDAGGPPVPAAAAGRPPAEPTDLTAEMPRVRLDWEPAEGDQASVPSGGSQQRFVDETMELPIFRELESAWFQTRPASAPIEPPVPVSVPQRRPGQQAAPAVRRPGGSDDAYTTPYGPPPRREGPATPAESYPTPVSGGASTVGGQPPRQPAEPVRAESRARWQTAADEGWQAAAALAEEQEFDTTETGLPRRVPMSQLVPGGVEKSATTVHRRTPEAVRGLLSAYHRGVQRGRTQQPKAGESKTPEPTTAGPQNSQGGKEQEG